MNGTNAIFPETEKLENFESDSLTMTKTGREGRGDQWPENASPIIFLSHNLFKILPMIVACWAIRNLWTLSRKPWVHFSANKKSPPILPISVSYDSRKVRFHQWKTTASPHPSLSCRSRQTSAPRHVTFPTVVTLVLKAAATSEASWCAFWWSSTHLQHLGRDWGSCQKLADRQQGTNWCGFMKGSWKLS